MVKHRRFSDKQKDDSIQKETEFQGNDIPAEKTSLDLKSLLLSGTKYAYIIGAVALLSGIFGPYGFYNPVGGTLSDFRTRSNSLSGRNNIDRFSISNYFDGELLFLQPVDSGPLFFAF